MQKKVSGDKDGILLVHKPSGMTSHDVVSIVRKKFKMRRVGHAGTLDPMATGLLILLVGKSTKLSNQFIGYDKAYSSTLLLGKTTTTADIEGDILTEKPIDQITEDQIRSTFEDFVGDQQQIPPMVSAVKVKGKKLYELARKGIVVEREPRTIHIAQITIDKINLPYIDFNVDCSKGTYVRQLGEDIGTELGCGACITRIERTRIGHYKLADAIKLEDIDECHLRNFEL